MFSMVNIQGVRDVYFGKPCVEQNFCSNPKYSEEVTSLLQLKKCHLYQLNFYMPKKFSCYHNYRLCPQNRLTVTTKSPLKWL